MKASTIAAVGVLALGCQRDPVQATPEATAAAGADSSSAAVTTPATTPPERPPLRGDTGDRVSAFREVERDDDRVFVRVDDEVQYELLAIDGAPVTDLLATAEREFGEAAWKRFREDVTMVLSAHALPLRWVVELTLRAPDGRLLRSQAELTREKRGALRKTRADLDRDHELSAEQWRGDLTELQRLIESRHAYATLRRVRLDAAVKRATERLRRGRVTVNRLAAEVSAILAELGDGHSRVADSADVMLPGFLPARVERVAGGLAALQPAEDTLLDPDHPFLVEIDGIAIDRWLAAALRWGTRGSPELDARSSIAKLRHVEQLRADLGLDRTKPVRLTLSDARGRHRVVERPVLDRWPRRQLPALEHRILDGNIGVLRIGLMIGDDAFLAALDEAMTALRDTDALVIDVRGNPGGGREVTRHLFAYFASETPIVANVATPRTGAASELSDRFLRPVDDPSWSEAERSVVRAFAARWNPEWTPPPLDFGPWHYFVVGRHLNPVAYPYDRPVAVLVDEECFSATDVFLGAFRHGTDAAFVGTPSSGGSGRARTYSLPHSGLRIRLSSMASFRPDGRLYDGRGIEVDRRVVRTLADVTGDDDSTLRTAIAIVTRAR
jgi:hypothetical protein